MNSKLTLLASLIIGACASHQAYAGTPIQWQAGKTKVNNGDLVLNEGLCYIAKNNPGSWETPSVSSWFWTAATCGSDVTPTLVPTIMPSLTPSQVPTVAPTALPTSEPTLSPSLMPSLAPLEPALTIWVAGKTKVKNGDLVEFNGQCFIAKNNPGSWESPSVNSWFWSLANCGAIVPSIIPSIAPSIAPTAIPTVMPTLAPSASPTVIPTLTPTAMPTLIPSVTPSLSPTLMPTPVAELTVIDDGAGGYLIPRTELSAIELAKTNSPLFNQVRFDISTLDNMTVEAVAPLQISNPENVLRVESILSEQQWNYFFPVRNEAYTYTRFLQAVAKFPAFCQSYLDGRNSDEICQRSLATMFAHFGQETGAHSPDWVITKGVDEWRQGLYFLREMYKSETVVDGTYSACGSWQGEKWPCAPGKSYFGRGAKQLSWNYNYGAFSQAMFGDTNVLLKNPELVADTWLNLASAVFFFVYPQPPKPSMLHVLDGTWQPNAADLAAGLKPGLGATIQIINGAYECGKGGAEDYRAQSRIDYYREFARELNLDISQETLGCAGMKAFSTEGAGALKINWDKDWGLNSKLPANQSFACKLVGYQTAYIALFQGDYEQCVEKHFNAQAYDENGQVIPAGQ